MCQEILNFNIFLLSFTFILNYSTCMFQIERKKEILSLLHKEGKVYVTELTDIFGVSGATIRTDLSELEQEGLLTRTHGGAIEVYRTGEDATLEERSTKRLSQKQAIAKAALQFISSGDSIIVDGGTTLGQFIEALAVCPLKDLTIITNYTPHIISLSKCPEITTMVTGGIYNKDIKATLGLPAIEMLAKFKADKVLLSATSVSVEQGITFTNVDDALVKRKMLEQAKTKILLTDSSKIGKSSLISAGSLSQIDVLITDWEILEDDVKEIKNLGVEVIVAPQPK